MSRIYVNDRKRLTRGIQTMARELDGTLTSETLAGLIVDALVDAGVVAKEDFDKAVAIASEEIDVRKGAGDY
jgi:hypothetical protein